MDICGSGFSCLLRKMGGPSKTRGPGHVGCLQKVSVVEMLKTSRLVNHKPKTLT